MAQQNAKGNNDSLVLAMFACGAAFFMWYIYREPVLAFVMRVSEYVFPYVAKLPAWWFFSEQTKYKIEALAIDLPNMAPELYGVGAFKMLMSLWGTSLRPLLVLWMLWMAYRYITPAPKYKYRGQLSLEKLIEHNAEKYPSAKVIIGKNLHKADLFVGPWRVAEDYISFACSRGLLLYKGNEMASYSNKKLGGKLKQRRKLLPHHSYVILDVEKTDEAFRRDLGPTWRGFGGISNPMVKALGIAFAACAMGGENRKKALTLIGNISRTFFEGGRNKKGKIVPHTADLSGSEELQVVVESWEDYREWSKKHAFETTMLMRLLKEGRRKGKITPATFLWLRPVLRRYWYPLHSLGSRKPKPEAAAVWGHFEGELLANKAISTPIVESATDGLEAALHKEQWITSERIRQVEEAKIAADMEAITREEAKQKPRKGRR